jgi:hypothetical protein
MCLSLHKECGTQLTALINQELKDEPWGAYCGARKRFKEDDSIIHYEKARKDYLDYY